MNRPGPICLRPPPSRAGFNRRLRLCPPACQPGPVRLSCFLCWPSSPGGRFFPLRLRPALFGLAASPRGCRPGLRRGPFCGPSSPSGLFGLQSLSAPSRPSPSPGRPPFTPLPRPSPLHPRGGPLAVLAQKGGAPRGGGRLVGARPTVPARAFLWAPRSQPGPARKGRMMRGPPLRGGIPPSSGGDHPPALRAAPPSGWALAASRL